MRTSSGGLSFPEPSRFPEQGLDLKDGGAGGRISTGVGREAIVKAGCAVRGCVRTHDSCFPWLREGRSILSEKYASPPAEGTR